jgi:hypothetical protein
VCRDTAGWRWGRGLKKKKTVHFCKELQVCQDEGKLFGGAADSTYSRNGKIYTLIHKQNEK